jgi:uroporphyrinogen decarboxylase
MPGLDSSHKDRVNKALKFEKPDRTPRDFAASPEIWDKLGSYFETQDRNEILQKLDIDCRVVAADSFCRPPSGTGRQADENGINIDIWGARRKKIKIPTGHLEEYESYPLESAQTVDDFAKHIWPQQDWWDFSELRSHINKINNNQLYNIRYRIGGFFETAWSIYNFEKFLLDLALNPAMPKYVLERIGEIHIQNLKIVLDKAADMIDIVYFYDDVASQNSLLIAPEMYEEFVKPYHAEVIRIASNYELPVMMHCCGSVYPLIDSFIDMGLRILNPIQPSAKNMNPEKLSDEFGGRIVFHGGIDIQKFLPFASPDEVKEKVEYTCNLLGSSGGYIMSGSHHIQSDTPLENVLAMYDLD